MTQSSAQRRILLVAATTGYQTRLFADAAARLNVAPILATDRCHVLPDPWGDQAIPVRFEDPEAGGRMAAQAAGKIDGVVAVGDRPAEIAAFAAGLLALPFHPAHAVAQSRNKFLTRERFSAVDLPVPGYFTVALRGDPARVAAKAAFPCVLKPLGLSASRGVIRANNPVEFAAAFERIRRILQESDVVRLHDRADEYIQVEAYIEGREFAVEALMTRGRFRPLAIFDKPDPLEGPFFEETIYTTPSRETPERQRELLDAAERAVHALGLWHGPVHIELRHGPQGTFVLEAAARPIGGLCAQVLRFEDGSSLEELIVRHAVGEDVSACRREDQASGVLMIPIPKSGVYIDVSGLDRARAVHGVQDVTITAKPGQKLLQLPEGASYLGFVFAKAATPGEAETALRRAHQELRFEIATELEILKAKASASDS